MKLIRGARAVVTCDAEDRVLWDVDVRIDGQKVVQFGKGLEAPEGCEVIDGTDKFVYPGLVNTHHHFFQTFVRNLTTIDYPQMTVPEWLDKIYRVFRLVDEDVIYYSALTAFADLVKHGCTTAFDHQYCYTSVSGKKLVDRQMDAAAQIGIRYHAGRGTNTLPREKGSTMPEEMLETTDEFLADCERLIGKYHDAAPFSMRRIVMAPCQPMNCYAETFTESLEMARKHGVFLHTHLGEGENAIIQARYGMRSLDWCEKIGFIGPDVWFAHGWEWTPEEYARIGRAGSGVSHCPGPAVLGGFPILNIADMLKKGVTVSLGCDGSATNDGSNLLDSLRMAYLMQTYYSKQRGGCLSAYEMLKAATVGGAKTLGRPELGSLEVGKAADLFLVDIAGLEYSGTLHDPQSLLARCGVTDRVWMTMIGGNVVYADGKLTGVDERTLAREAEATCTRVLRNRVPYFPKFGA
mgnify:CR=1 FL=1